MPAIIIIQYSQVLSEFASNNVYPTNLQKDIQDNLRSLLNEIEKRVDPFDYEMMNEALHQNLTQSIAKNASLYWLLSSNQSKKNLSLGQKLEVGTSQHNLIDLVGSSGGKPVKTNLRFAMLPVSGYTLTDVRSAVDFSTISYLSLHLPFFSETRGQWVPHCASSFVSFAFLFVTTSIT